MKKNCQFTLMLIFTSSTLFGQWTTGTDINNTNTGNVGIGTVPSFRFHIKGKNPNTDLMTLGSTTTGNFALTSTDGGAYGLFGGVSNTGRAWLQAGRYDSNVAYDLTLQTAGGNVGIGTTTPQAKLEIVGSGQFIRNPIAGGYSTLRLYNDQNNNLRTLEIDYSGSSYGGALVTGGLTGESASITTTGSFPLTFGTANTARITIIGNGNVGIGTTNPGAYKLAVEGKIGAREVNVTTTTPWPDFVFETDYSLPSLESLKVFIDKNKHLPEIPTSQEVETNGINLGEMNTLLLKKIEELTLYVIEQNKLIINQNERISTLENKN
jgi:hypothetical protein